jgi:hypothetical protein
VSLTDCADHKISETLPAKRILDWLYEVEEQSLNADELEAKEKQFSSRYFEGGFYVKTPCMVTEQWSPISAMVERGMAPEVLNREPGFRAAATGIWAPPANLEQVEIESASTDEELFWAIIGAASRLAVEQNAWINVIAQPGWHRPAAINSLVKWPPEEVAKAGRLLWKRTSEG